MTLFGTIVPSILTLLCLVVHASSDDTEELTRLAINLDVPFDRDLPLGKYRKTGFSFCNGPIHYYSRNFSQFITQSHVIVDKSLFIKSILESPHKAILFNIPRRWGKTMALNWLKAFLEIEVDPETGLEYEFPAEKENYLIFKRGHIRGVLKLKEPLLITKHAELMDKYHGKWPVIHQRLRVFPVMDMENAETLLLLAVANAYYRHSYLLQSYQNIQNSTNSTEYQKQEARELAQKFEVYLTGEMTPEQTVVGLRYLSELLHNHFKRKVFILVDDYDDLINFLLVESWPEEKDKIMQFYLSFLRNTLCDNPHIEKIVAAGVSPVPLSYAPDIFGQFVVYGYINNPYWQFFGYHVREIKLFVDYLQITAHNATEMHEWYNGYFIGVHQPHRIYNPHLINFFWETKEHRNYVWEPRSGLIEILVPRFWNIPGFEEIWAVLNSGTADVTIQANLLDLPYHRFERLINAVANPNNDIHVDGTDILDIIFNYLILLGYFSWTDLPYPIINQITNVTLKIPNKSFFYRLRNDTFEFYAERYLRVAKGLPSETLQQYGQAVEASFTELVENECNVTDLFRGAFTKFLTIVPQLLRIKPIMQLVPESNVSTTPKPPTLFNYPVPATDERLVRSSLYCIFGYSTKRRFRIQDARVHGGGKKTDIILTRGLHAAVINLKYTQENDTFVLNNQTVHEIIDDSYVDIFKKSRHFEHIRTVSLVAVHVRQSEFAQVRVQAWNHIIHW